MASIVNPDRVPLLTGDVVTKYRKAFESINDQLNTMQAEIDLVNACDTWSATALCGDLADMARNVELLARTISELSIRKVGSDDDVNRSLAR